MGVSARLVLALSVVAALGGTVARAAPGRPLPRILVLHSYHHGFTWSDQISRGITAALAPRRDEVELLFEFMDTRRHATDAYLGSLHELLRSKYAARPPDVLICADDHALTFALGRGEDLFGRTPTVFCSVTGYSAEMRRGRELTGLQESLQIKPTLDVALRLHPRTRKVAVINDRTRTGRAIRRVADRTFAAYRDRLQFAYLENLTIEELGDRVATLDEGTIIFLFLFSRDRAGRVFSQERHLRRLVRRARVPIYSVWEFYLGHGIVGGRLTDGEAEGKLTGALALRVLDGARASAIPLGHSPTRFAFDYRQLERFGVPLAQLPAGSRVVNRPHSFFVEHRRVFLGVSAVFAALLAIVGLLAINVLRRQRAERALKRSEELYRKLVDNAEDAIFILVDGRIAFANPRTVELTGLPEARLAQTAFEELLHEEDRHRVADAADSPNPVTVRMLDAAETLRWTVLSAVRVTWVEQPAILCFLRDVTRQRQLEEQLQLAQKLEAVGTLAGGVAHDFNNLLTGIRGHIELILHGPELSDGQRRRLEEIDEQVDRATELTRDLLGFARRGKVTARPLAINELVDSTSTMFGRARKELTIRRNLQPDVWAVVVDRGQLEQVLLNLYLNAWHAMPDGGELHLGTANTALDAEIAAAHDVVPGRFVKISVTDSGIGMDDEVRRRVFEPFFTTRELGRGTGLGLAVVYGIVRDHAGAISVRSVPGKGSTFEIYLPATEQPVPTATAVADKALPTGDETILVVDDEPVSRLATLGMLERLGYTVIAAESGAEAMELYQERSREIAVVVLDLIMPDMSGAETFDALRALDPAVRVLLVSGYGVGQAQRILERGCDGFIQKPYGVRALGQRLREILDHPATADAE